MDGKSQKKKIYMSHKIVHHKWGRRISLNSPMHMQECPIYPSVFSSDFPCHLNARRSEWFIFKPAQVCHKLESSKKKIDAMVCWKIWGFWHSFSYKIVLKRLRHPIQLPNYMGCLTKFYMYFTLTKELAFQNLLLRTRFPELAFKNLLSKTRFQELAFYSSLSRTCFQELAFEYLLSRSRFREVAFENSLLSSRKWVLKSDFSKATSRKRLLEREFSKASSRKRKKKCHLTLTR
jgi:hypothetical protein